MIPLSFITYNESIHTYSFSPNTTTDIGTHTVAVTLSDGNMQTSYSFTVKVMTKPAFNNGTTTFSALGVALNGVKSFPIPSFSDADGDNVTLSIAEGSGGILPSWILLNNTSLQIVASPKNFTDVGTHNVQLVLKTVNEEVSFPFSIIVANTAPYFTSAP